MRIKTEKEKAQNKRYQEEKRARCLREGLCVTCLGPKAAGETMLNCKRCRDHKNRMQSHFKLGPAVPTLKHASAITADQLALLEKVRQQQLSEGVTLKRACIDLGVSYQHVAKLRTKAAQADVLGLPVQPAEAYTPAVMPHTRLPAVISGW